jgi:hypothetical protein
MTYKMTTHQQHIEAHNTQFEKLTDRFQDPLFLHHSPGHQPLNLQLQLNSYLQKHMA